MKPIVIEATKTRQQIINQIKILRVAPYARVSSESEMQANSFEAQVRYYTEFVNSNPNWQLVKVYSDEGITGTNAHKRTGLKELLRDCKAGKIDMIICKSLSRLCRNTADTLKIVRMTRELGIDIFFENENIHTITTDGEFLITIFASLAQDTSRQISDNVNWGHDKSMQKGTIYGNGNILGYEKVGNKLVINEEQARAVKAIFNYYLEGYGTRRICTLLEQEGYKTAKGKTHWTVGAVQRVLKNEKYCGHLLLGKKYTVDYLTHKRKNNEGEKPKYLFIQDDQGNPVVPPIISEAMFKKAQQELKRRGDMNGVDKRKNTRYTNAYPFSGKLICKKCGAKMCRLVYYRGTPNEQVMWKCATFMTRGKEECDMPSISEELLINLVTQTLHKIKNNKNDVLQTFMDKAQEVINETGYESELADVEKQISDLNNELKSLRTMRRRNEITEDEFLEDYGDIKQQIEQLETAHQQILSRHQTIADKEQRLKMLQTTLDKEFNELVATDEIIRGLVEKIEVHSRTKIDVFISGDITANFEGKAEKMPCCTTHLRVDSTICNTLDYIFFGAHHLIFEEAFKKRVLSNKYKNVDYSIYLSV